MSFSRLSLKLFIDKETNKILFAETGKETIDFLFSILTLPVARIISLLLNQSTVGSLENLYQSVQSLNNAYLHSNEHRNLLLKPKVPTLTQGSSLFTLTNEPKQRKRFYKCSAPISSYTTRDKHEYVTDNPKITCPDCSKLMNVGVPVLGGVREVADRGFVKGVVTYMVMDDLVVKPMSTTTTIALLAKFNVKDVEALEEREVYLDANMGLKLLKVAFQSKNVLSSIFLPQEDESAVDAN